MIGLFFSRKTCYFINPFLTKYDCTDSDANFLACFFFDFPRINIYFEQPKRTETVKIRIRIISLSDISDFCSVIG